MRRRLGSNIRLLPHGLAVLYEDKDLLLVDKPAGLLTVATAHENARTAHSILTGYVQRGCGRARKYLTAVHRLDRDTSGVLIFAKSQETLDRLQDHWKEIEKKYLAIVHGAMEKKAGTITSYLAEDAGYNVYETTDSTKGKLAQSLYRVIGEKKGFSLLEVTLLTGRKNQVPRALRGHRPPDRRGREVRIRGRPAAAHGPSRPVHFLQTPLQRQTALLRIRSARGLHQAVRPHRSAYRRTAARGRAGEVNCSSRCRVTPA